MDVTEKQAEGTMIELPVIEEKVSVGDLVPIENFKPAQLKTIRQIQATVSLDDVTTIDSFAVKPQLKVSDYLSKLDANIRNEDLGGAQNLILELSRSFKKLNIPVVIQEVRQGGPKGVMGALSKLPVVGDRFSSVQRFFASRDRVDKDIQSIVQQSNKELLTLRATNKMLDTLVVVTEENIEELELHLCAGQQALLRMREDFHAFREECRKTPSNAIKLAKLNDMRGLIASFENKMVRVAIQYTKAIKSISSIRMLQESGRAAYSEVMNSVILDVPDIQSAILQVAAVRRVMGASNMADARRQLAREIHGVLDVALEQTVIATKQRQGDYAQDLAALASGMQTIKRIQDTGFAIDEDSKVKRAEALRLIADLQREFNADQMAHAERALN